MKMIIMAGGSGTRLWPLSRTHYPKQFLKLNGMEKSIFQLTLERCLLMGSMDDIYIVSNGDYFHLIQGQIEEMRQTASSDHILLEPQPKNTLPAIMFAVKQIRRSGDDICAVFASDHIIDHPEVLAKTVLDAQALARHGFVTFGITPTNPETGFGYIKPGASVPGGMEVAQFKEKPDLAHAKEYCANGYLWNSGIFMFESKQFADDVERINPEVYHAFQKADYADAYTATPSISIDYGLIEKLDRVFCVPLPLEWNDLGNFTTFYSRYETEQDENGNICFSNEIMLDCRNDMVYSEGGKAIALIGMTDTVVVDQKDALLICNREHTQDVKEVVARLKAVKDPRVDDHLTCYNAWGTVALLEQSAMYRICRLSVLPLKQMEMRINRASSMHWIVLKGSALLEIGGEKKLLSVGESFYAQAQTPYRLSNPSAELLKVITVQVGNMADEDVIVLDIVNADV